MLGAQARAFATGALAGGVAEAAAAFACAATQWRTGEPLAPLLETAGIAHVLVPYLPTGWTRDALWPGIAPLDAEGRVTTFLGGLDRATWPLAKAGFFGVAKAIDGLIAQCAIHPASGAISTAN